MSLLLCSYYHTRCYFSTGIENNNQIGHQHTGKETEQDKDQHQLLCPSDPAQKRLGNILKYSALLQSGHNAHQAAQDRQRPEVCIAPIFFVQVFGKHGNASKGKGRARHRFLFEKADHFLFYKAFPSKRYHTTESSSRKSMIPIFKIPLSSYQRFRMSCRTMILGKESPVSKKGLFSVSAFFSSGSARADWI